MYPQHCRSDTTQSTLFFLESRKKKHKSHTLARHPFELKLALMHIAEEENLSDQSHTKEKKYQRWGNHE